MRLAFARKPSVLIVAMLIASCGDDSITIDNVSAEGSVGGMIVNAASRAPMADVQVGLIAGGTVFEAVATGADGSFAFDSVPAGGVIVTITGPAGFESAWLRGDLPAAAGEYPSGNSTLTFGPIGLVPIDSEFSFRVLDESGIPVSGYLVGVQTAVQYVDLGAGVPDARGEVLKTATTDADGYASFSTMPNYFAMGPSVPDAVIVFLPPRDANLDGIFEFGGGDRVFNLRDLDDPTPDVVLTAGYSTTLTVRASTISALVVGGGAQAVIQRNGSIHVSFNLPIQASADVTVVDEYGNALSSQPSISISDDNLTISFAAAQLEASAEYNLAIHAVAAVGDRLVQGDFVASFFTVPEGISVSVVDSIRDDATQLTTLTLSEPIGGHSGSLTGSDCVMYFEADLDSSGSTGDFPNELGYTSCSVQLYPSEPNPAGIPGLSGYTTRWAVTAPLAGGGTPLPSGTSVHVLFSAVANASRIVEHPDGSPVNDLIFQLP